MKIVVSTRFGHAVGGIEIYLECVLQALLDRGHDVRVWHSAPADVTQRSILPASLPEAWVGSDVSRTDAIARDIAAWQPDVVFSHGMTHAALEDRLRAVAPLVVLLHAYDGTCISGSKCHAFPDIAPCTRALGPGCLLHYYPRRCGGLSPLTMVASYREQRQRQAVLRDAACVTTLSQHMRREAINQGVDARRAHCLPMFVPHQQRFEARSDAGRASDGRTHLLFLGRLEPLKGPRVLIHALGQLEASVLQSIRVTMAGDGRERQRCEDDARRLIERGLQIQFTGWLAPAAAAALVTTAHLLVVPSIWPEPLGLVGLEAAAAGVPSLAFDLGGIPQWLDDGVTGMLVRGHPSAEGMARALSACLTDPERLTRWGREAAHKAAGLTLQRHLEALELVLESVRTTGRETVQ